MAPLTDYLILDISTAPIADAAEFVEPSDAPSNYGADAAEKFRQKSKADKIEKCGLDADLCQITGIAFRSENEDGIYLATNGWSEQRILERSLVSLRDNTVLIGFNALRFDWPVLMRRCHYLGLDVPPINLDKYRTPHIDLYDRLSHHGTVSAHSLSFYVKRHGWTDLVKPLSGADESRVLETGDWDGLAASLRHDVTATYRLAQWLGVIPKNSEAAYPMGNAATEKKKRRLQRRNLARTIAGDPVQRSKAEADVRPTPPRRFCGRQSGEPDWSQNCLNCGATPIVPASGLCGPCTFGEAETSGGNW